MKPEPRDPRSLKRHPLLKHFPAPDKKSAEWKGFADRVQADGKICVPVRGTAAGFVLQGWWEVEAASDWQFKTVPYQIEDDSRAALVIVEGLFNRESMSVGAKVYFALGLWPQYVAAHEDRRRKNCIDQRTTNEEALGERSLVSTNHPPSIRYLGQLWGCNHATILQAGNVRQIFHDLKFFSAWLKKIGVRAAAQTHAQLQTELRAEFEPLLFNGEKSLWTILQALAGRLTGARKDPAEEQLDLFTDQVAAWPLHWKKLDEQARRVWERKMADEFAAHPDDLFDACSRALDKARERRKRMTNDE